MESAPVMAAFRAYRDELDAVNERRERLVKASRDVTIHSKKLISQIHRVQPASMAAELAQAQRDLGAIRDQQLSRVAAELQVADQWRFHSSYSPGVQEFVEAAAFLEFRSRGGLLSLGRLNRFLESVGGAAGRPFAVDAGDYLLGLADLSGELMRLAVTSAAGGDRRSPARVGEFVRALFAGFRAVPPNAVPRHGLRKKVEVMEQSLQKIENAIYTLHVRSSEFPDSAPLPSPHAMLAALSTPQVTVASGLSEDEL